LSISESLCQSDVVVIRVPKELKKRMKNARINWSEEIRAFIERRLRRYELHNMLKIVRERSRGRRVSVDSTKLIREDREL
jgi:hypothetical protein